MKKVLYLYDKSKCTLKCTYIEFYELSKQIYNYYSVTFKNVVIIYDYMCDTRYLVAVDRMSKVWRKVIADESKLIIV